MERQRRLGFYKRMMLELNHAVLMKRIDEHELHQLFWECTLRCNLNCRHCGSDCRMLSEQDDMPLDDFLKVLDEVKRHEDPQKVVVITTGGEPMMRRDLAQCGRAITERGFVWGMVTNGMMLSQDKLDEFVDAGLKTIAVSFDGFEDDHNWMRGNPLSYKNVLVAIEALKRHPELTWDVITCVNKRTVKYLPQFRDYLVTLGVTRWRLFTVFPFGRAEREPELKLSNEEFVEMMEFIKATRLQGKIRADYGCDGFLGSYEGEVRNHYYSCSAGINVASILADGSISGCLSIRSDYHQGNIYTDSFWEVWQNRYQEYRDRRWMKTDQCSHCKMWRYCQGNGFHLRDSDGKLRVCQYRLITQSHPKN
ncbi:MAG: TIGR04133 family radical SAM/SPASM protein [Bacteroidales bacterium]|nr:TIGR04133 family radical SAM/SPASM protein [Bacteroidales bacterium]